MLLLYLNCSSLKQSVTDETFAAVLSNLLHPVLTCTFFWTILGSARNCMRLQVLELDHVSEINQEVAAEVCREGLKGLEMLVLTSTPVTPKALLHFNSEFKQSTWKLIRAVGTFVVHFLLNEPQSFPSALILVLLV